ncbi:methionine ABC transporter ATP-binding protein [Harryflintia acetispora]|uniref:D-methionine transport system ATP-binding protein n=1 Tax=Harryflintia acetispora TaxID=1849041 RepID=A0A9X8Y8A6_9FIRM|nr:ATP-binding cassette domain-containing protein [Harryflintia acetispora]TCL43519.1 D-methionine transport system ATP-binding protein [Harryflintia acetispora]
MGEPMIEIKGLCKSFETKNGRVDALQNIDLTIGRGDIFGVIGMSGAGKSTLVRCMNQLERPDRGQVLFDGVDLCALPAKELRQARRQMSMIFQQFNLLEQRTALQNVCFPLEIAGEPKENARARGRELLQLVGLTEREGAYPAQLSGGQKQRVAIARALSTNPKVLLCDEATSALDPTTTASILALLQKINRTLGITIVIITHEMSVIEEICNRVAIIDRSAIAECGRVDEIFQNPQSEAARKLVYPEGRAARQLIGRRCLRIVFDGSSSFEPVIANMVLACKAPINILFANTKNIEGRAFGQMVVQTPEDQALVERMIRYLHAQNLTAEEVSGYVE